MFSSTMRSESSKPTTSSLVTGRSRPMGNRSTYALLSTTKQSTLNSGNSQSRSGGSNISYSFQKKWEAAQSIFIKTVFLKNPIFKKNHHIENFVILSLFNWKVESIAFMFLYFLDSFSFSWKCFNLAAYFCKAILYVQHWRGENKQKKRS